MKLIKITTDNVITMTDVTENGEPLYETVRKDIGGFMENVYPKGLPQGFVMIVDDEGRCKGKPINPIGSYLYQTHLHGEPIVGDVVILKLGYYQDEPDIVGIPDSEAIQLIGKFLEIERSNLK